VVFKLTIGTTLVLRVASGKNGERRGWDRLMWDFFNDIGS
jgi:hypothetical protein